MEHNGNGLRPTDAWNRDFQPRSLTKTNLTTLAISWFILPLPLPTGPSPRSNDLSILFSSTDRSILRPATISTERVCFSKPPSKYFPSSSACTIISTLQFRSSCSRRLSQIVLRSVVAIGYLRAWKKRDLTCPSVLEKDSI